MIENDSTHDMRVISDTEWQTFFADLVQKYRGQIVSTAMGQDLLVDNPPQAKVVLLGIAYDKHNGVVISTRSDVTTETHGVKSPDLVWAVYDEDGKLVAVEIIGEDGRNLILFVAP